MKLWMENEIILTIDIHILKSGLQVQITDCHQCSMIVIIANLLVRN